MSGARVTVEERPTVVPVEARTWRWSMAGVGALSLALGVWIARRPGHTGDEAFSALLAEKDFGSWWEIISRQELNGSAHAVVLRLWAMTGTSDAWLRVPSVLAMVASIPVVMLLARRLTGSATVAVLAGVVLAVNPLAIRYSAEGRGYTLFLLLSAVSTLLLVRYVQERRPSDLTWWGLLGVLLLYTHLFTVLLLLAQGVAVLFHPARRELLRASWRGLAIIVAGAMPAAVYLATNDTSNIDWIDEPGVRDVLKLGRDLVAGSSWVLAAVVGAAVCGGLVVGWRAARSSPDPDPDPEARWPVAALLVLAAVGPVLAVAISQIHPIVTVKYLMASLPAVSILAALGLAWLRQLPRLVAVGLIVVLGVSDAATATRPDPAQVVDLLVERGRPGDGVLIARFAHRVQIERAVVTSHDVPVAEPVYPAGDWGELDLVVARQRGLSAELDDFVAAGGSRLWLVSTPNADGRRGRRSVLADLGVEPVEAHRTRGALVELLELPAPPA